MDFVDYDALQTGENTWRVFIADQQGKAFGGGEQNMWRVGTLATFAARRCITGAVFDPYWQVHLGHWCIEVAFDVGGQRFEWRDIDRMKALPWTCCQIDQAG